ncbi:hypothetical protein FDZ74_17755 [bacterium]|nr:MAG: hypothetical protein FDZ74_17755 [bacterium]
MIFWLCYGRGVLVGQGVMVAAPDWVAKPAPGVSVARRVGEVCEVTASVGVTSDGWTVRFNPGTVCVAGRVTAVPAARGVGVGRRRPPSR